MSKIIRGYCPFREGGGPRDYIACCKCPKTQSIASPRSPTGLSVASAKAIGWISLGEKWVCPAHPPLKN